MLTSAEGFGLPKQPLSTRPLFTSHACGSCSDAIGKRIHRGLYKTADGLLINALREWVLHDRGKSTPKSIEQWDRELRSSAEAG